MSDGATAGDWPGRVAVIGGGTMGGGFAQLLGVNGVDVAVVDSTPARTKVSVANLKESAKDFERRGLLGTGDAKRVAGRVRGAESIADAVADVDLVIEAVFEDPAVKREIYEEVEANAPDDAVLATNTSAIPIRDLSASLHHPERFLGTHWFNPPQWVPCVEVIPGPDTAGAVIERVFGFLTAIGKSPVKVGDAAGFVANRIQFAMFKEAASCVADGVASPEEVDRIVRSSFGFRLPFFGPFAIADMAGLDVYAGAYEALEDDLGPRFSAPARLIELIEEGRSGTKPGGGFLDLPSESIPAMIEGRDASYAALSELIERLEAES
jgi:3-hydroxybutyryl-CoA dehydrogenase